MKRGEREVGVCESKGGGMWRRWEERGVWRKVCEREVCGRRCVEREGGMWEEVC